MAKPVRPEARIQRDNLSGDELTDRHTLSTEHAREWKRDKPSPQAILSYWIILGEIAIDQQRSIQGASYQVLDRDLIKRPTPDPHYRNENLDTGPIERDML